MSGDRVVVTDHDFDDLAIEQEILDEVAEVIDLAHDGDASSGDDLGSALEDADAVLNLRATIDERHIRRMTDCQIITRYGIGVDNIDLDAATEQGIPVANVPDYCIEEVAAHTVALAIALLRGLKPYDQSIADGRWDREAGPALHRLSSLTVGIVGFGSIGRAVSERFHPFGPEIIASDPFLGPSDVKEYDVDLVDFEDLISTSDLVTIHSPLTESTRGLFDMAVFNRLDADAYLVNVSRGPIVDTDDLRSALNAGKLAGAGLDVFPEEPPDEADPLRDHPAVITTPHVAWYSEESNLERRRSAAKTVRNALTGHRLDNVVNGIDQ